MKVEGGIPSLCGVSDAILAEHGERTALRSGFPSLEVLGIIEVGIGHQFGDFASYAETAADGITEQLICKSDLFCNLLGCQRTILYDIAIASVGESVRSGLDIVIQVAFEHLHQGASQLVVVRIHIGDNVVDGLLIGGIRLCTLLQHGTGLPEGSVCLIERLR